MKREASGSCNRSGTPQFPNLNVVFGANGKGVIKITDLDTKRNLDSSVIEHELVKMISSSKTLRASAVQRIDSSVRWCVASNALT